MLFALSLCGVQTRNCVAATVETLLMPGKLSAAHAKLEETCANCHDRSNRARMTQLCVACHEAIGKDLAGGRGFHGHMLNADKTQCTACHTEHKGRTAHIAEFAREGFEHKQTDFPLEGAHASLGCESCHHRGQAYRNAETACVACHRGEDVHKGTLGTQCGDCHKALAWQEVSFDHDKTAFKLRDRHGKIECAACHFGPRYKGTPKTCADCHAPDDVHRGSRGEDCAKCHTTAGWKTAKFDHAKETGFALNGAHADITCIACHRSGNVKDKIAKDCQGCHASQDAHAGRFDRDCASCHAEDRWHPLAYDHLKEAHFALLGAHEKLDCHACHTAELSKQKLGNDCKSCHAAEDPHGGSLRGDCGQCHGSTMWRGGVKFDHDLTTYPLIGQHVLASCAQCHTSLKFKGATHECIDCHAPQDVHKGTLGRECATCHSPNGWNQWQFDHAKETNFALQGAHAKLTCIGCHRQPPKQVKLPTECVGCHQKDDVHVGEFGRQCQRCHSSVSFAAQRIQ